MHLLTEFLMPLEVERDLSVFDARCYSVCAQVEEVWVERYPPISEGPPELSLDGYGRNAAPFLKLMNVNPDLCRIKFGRSFTDRSLCLIVDNVRKRRVLGTYAEWKVIERALEKSPDFPAYIFDSLIERK